MCRDGGHGAEKGTADEKETQLAQVHGCHCQREKRIHGFPDPYGREAGTFRKRIAAGCIVNLGEQHVAGVPARGGSKLLVDRLLGLWVVVCVKLRLDFGRNHRR